MNKITITNEVGLSLKVVLCWKQYFLKPQESKDVYLDSLEFSIDVFPIKKSSVKVNWPLIIFENLLGSLPENYFTNRLTCSYHMDAMLRRNVGKIVFFSNEISNEDYENSNYFSVTPICDNVMVFESGYKVIDKNKIKRKFKLKHLLFFSVLPVIIAELIVFLIKPTVSNLLCATFLFIVGLIPTIIRIKRFNKFCNNDNANICLKKYMDIEH